MVRPGRVPQRAGQRGDLFLDRSEAGDCDMKPCCVHLASWALLLGASAAMAQPPAARHPDAPPAAPKSSEVSLSDVKATPEMWFYLQERQRYDSPKMAVRRNAELAAARRGERIASQQWLGQSPERPNVYSTIFGGHFPGTFPYGNADRWNIYYSYGSPRPNR